MKKMLASVVLIIFSGFLITDAKTASDAVVEGVNACLTTIIPSLFAFMVISSFLISTGLNRFIFKPLFAISRLWFKGDENVFSVFIASLFGGYPIGMKLFSELISYNKNYSEIGEKYLSFCYCPSPTFVIGIVGLGIFKSTQAGLIVYLSNALSCVLLAFIINIFSRKRFYFPCRKRAEIDFSKLSDSIKGAVKTLSVICACVILFRLFSSFITATGVLSFLSDDTASFIQGFFEISSLTSCAADFNLLPFYSLLASSGGLCIIFQVTALAPKGFRMRYFLLGRVFCSFTSYIFTLIFLNLFNPVLAVASQNSVKMFSANPICSFCLIIMCYILLKLPQKNSKKQ